MRPSTKRFSIPRLSLLLAFLSLIFFISCSKSDSTPTPTPADKTALQASIAAAQALYDGTVEGTKPGQYEAGSKAAFKTVLDAAKAVSADAGATQTAVTNANAQLTAAVATYQTHRINEIAAVNLIGFWKMNGNANDSSGNGNNGELKAGADLYGAGTPSPAVDRFGRAGMAYHFDHGGNIEVPYKAALNPQQITVSLWCKKDTVGRTWAKDAYYMVALDRWNGYKFQFQGTNRPFFTVRTVRPAGDTNYINQDSNLSLDSLGWYHVVATYKQDTMNFYVNGTKTASWTGPDAPGIPVIVPNGINLTIGQDLPTDKYLTVDGDFQVAWGGFWTGELDDVMIYNVALDAPQVKSIYDNQKTP